MMELTGIIMAGGKSSRMGEDKGLKLYKGKALVTYPLEVLRNISNEIIISANNKGYNQFGYPLIKDEILGIGPIGGLCSALKISSSEWNFVLACDMPFVSGRFLSSLVNEIEKGYDAIVPQNEKEQFEALCAVYSKSCIPFIENKIRYKKYGLYQLLNELNVKKIQVSEDNRNFINLNTLDEFQQATKNL